MVVVKSFVVGKVYTVQGIQHHRNAKTKYVAVAAAAGGVCPFSLNHDGKPQTHIHKTEKQNCNEMQLKGLFGF